MPAVRGRLLLTYDSEELGGGGARLVGCNGVPVPWTGKEPAGHAFHAAALRRLGLERPEEAEGAAAGKERTESPAVDSYHFKGRKNRQDGDGQDHYALLGLSHLRYLATEEQIRKSYRDVALKHHPDKQAALLSLEETEEARERKKEEVDRHFKAIQEAYENLIDPTKRRLYDSVDEFDDEVPSDCAPEDFFKIFDPVFLRNGRWSLNNPVPGLGEDSTSIAEVDAFYNFWYSFRSWREFPHADEFDLEQAESREHKRLMERQNAKLRGKAKKEEIGRIRTLVENAYKRDPRILRRKEDEKAERQRKKEAQILAKQEKEQETARALEEERLRKVEEDRQVALTAAAQKKVKEKEKKLLRKERQRLRAAAAAVAARKEFGVGEDAIDLLCSSLEMVAMTGLCERLENSKDVADQAELIRSVLRGNEGEVVHPEISDASPVKSAAASDGAHQPQAPLWGDGKKVQADGHKGSAEGAEQPKKTTSALGGGAERAKPWSKAEVEMLRKAHIKYPKGTPQRWEVVSEYVGTGRTVEEIKTAIKTELARKPDPSKAFDSFLSKRKPGATDIASPLSTRDDAAASAAPTAASDVRADGPKPDQKGKLGSTVVVNTEEGRHANTGFSGSQSQTNGVAAPAPAPVEDISADGVDQESWSNSQELALVKALRTFPKDSTQRWERIAAAVPGKTKVQCMKKVTEMRASFRKSKGGD